MIMSTKEIKYSLEWLEKGMGRVETRAYMRNMLRRVFLDQTEVMARTRSIPCWYSPSDSKSEEPSLTAALCVCGMPVFFSSSEDLPSWWATTSGGFILPASTVAKSNKRVVRRDVEDRSNFGGSSASFLRYQQEAKELNTLVGVACRSSLGSSTDDPSDWLDWSQWADPGAKPYELGGGFQYQIRSFRYDPSPHFALR
jgi:hypothetical protein